MAPRQDDDRGARVSTSPDECAKSGRPVTARVVENLRRADRPLSCGRCGNYRATVAFGVWIARRVTRAECAGDRRSRGRPRTSLPPCDTPAVEGDRSCGAPRAKAPRAPRDARRSWTAKSVNEGDPHQGRPPVRYFAENGGVNPEIVTGTAGPKIVDRLVGWQPTPLNVCECIVRF